MVLQARRIGYSVGFARDIVAERMKAYSAALPPIYARFQGSYLALGAPGRGVECLAGGWGPRSIMIGRFPTLEAVRSFWWSAAYRAAAELRRGAVTVDIAAVEGEAPPDAHEALLVIAHPPGTVTSALLEALSRALTLHASAARALVCASGLQVESLEGQIGGYTLAIVSFADEATLQTAWPSIAATLSAAGAAPAAYAVRRLRAPGPL